jgi:hypothetical protein
VEKSPVSLGVLVMVAGLVLLLIGLYLLFADSIGLGIACLAVGAAMEGFGYILKNRAKA